MKRMVILVAAVMLVVAGCGESNGGTDGGESASGKCGSVAQPSTTETLSDAAGLADRITQRGKPEVWVPAEKPTALASVDVIVGFGDPITAESKVSVQYVGVAYSDCKEFDSSWKRGQPASFALSDVIKGWSQGLVGMKPGGRRHLVIPSDLAYGESPGSGQPGGPLIFVVDLISASKPLTSDPAAEAAANQRGKPTVAKPDHEITSLEIVDDVVGTGTEVKEGAEVRAHYLGVDAAGMEFDSSWKRGEPVSFSLDQVIKGWSLGLVGMKVGGRRTLSIPASLAYGDSPPQGAPAGALVFVVDLLGATE